MFASRRKRLSRNCVDTSDKVSVRRWRKRLGKSAKEVEAALAKVANNAESVTKELEMKRG
jgi:predicted secreted protein